MERGNYLIENMTKLIELFSTRLQKENKQQNVSPVDGPKTELVFWKKKLQNVILLSEMINSPEVQFVKENLLESNKRLDEKKT